MEDLKRRIEDHYLKKGLYEDIVERLVQQGIDLGKVNRSDIAGVDEFHVRGADVSNELASSIDLRNASILDVGCGLGGPCRMLAEEYHCQTTGIDLSKEYIRTAKKLSKLLKLDDKTTFIQGDASHLPFEDDSFDVVWTQHVQMNIPDKRKFYSEINRVLKRGGHFLYYEIFKKSFGEIHYPLPWAGHHELSFLFEVKQMEDILLEMGLTKIRSTDQTQKGIHFFETLLKRLEKHGPPKMGLNLLMGESTKPKLSNLLGHLKGNDLSLESGIYAKTIRKQ